jgi:hypothetical protein
MNEAHRQPTLTLAVGRAYLAAHDPKMIKRSWQAVMDEMATHGISTTQERCARALRSKAYNAIRHKPLVETTGEPVARHQPISPGGRSGEVADGAGDHGGKGYCPNRGVTTIARWFWAVPLSAHSLGWRPHKLRNRLQQRAHFQNQGARHRMSA